MIREALEGKRLLLTGATGFLGSALLERLVFDTPVARVDVVIRGDAETRMKWVAAGSVFGPVRQRLGAEKFSALIDEKVRVLPADLAAGPPEVGSDVDLVIHSAATVSFDPPIDDAFRTNLLGTTDLYEAAGGKPFLHVSTAYVAGLTRGTQSEELLARNIDWKAEAANAMELARQAEIESRKPEVLDRLRDRAEREIGKAGPQSTARRAEELRTDWVRDRGMRLGRSRARSLGWPDVYTFTKALAEIALDSLAGDAPVAIVRPSIIESALEHPYPGWIEGFRMADPVMLGFGRGALPEFPGIPEGVIDVIPVDLVVNCILAVAANMPEHRAVYHCSSGHRNPLSFRKIYEHTRDYFLLNPLPERDRGTHKVPTWSFPGRRAVGRKISTAERLVEAAERLTGRMPRNRLGRQTSRRVDRLRRRLDFVKRYADLYGPYAEIEVIYTDDRTKALFESLPEPDRRDFAFDPTSFTWDGYLKEIHLPMVTAPLRFPEATRLEPKVVVTPNGSGSAPVLAVFDIEGTVVDSNVVETYTWLRLSEIDDPAERAATILASLAKAPRWISSERRDRGEFLRSFYRQYSGVHAEDLRALARGSIADLMLRKMAPAAVRRIREHRKAGHGIVFITGSLDFVIEPLAFLADEVVAARMREVGGIFNGDLERPPLVGEARAAWLRDYASAIGADLSASYSYADSLSDLPLLESTGNPVAVNPDVALYRIARARKWPVEEWAPEKGAPRLPLPEVVRS